jgi:hypothetical protein
VQGLFLVLVGRAPAPVWDVSAKHHIELDTMLADEVDMGKAILRDYIEATIGFEKLGEGTGTHPKSLIGMFGPRGNPQAKCLFRSASADRGG